MELNTTAQPGTVVVGFDGSEHAELAVRWAADEATSEGRPLSIVHVVKPMTGFEVSALASTWVLPDDAWAAIRAEAADELVALRARLRANLPELEVELVLATGDPRQVLLELSVSASSLFVGSRGRGLLGSLLLGSVSVAVSRAARCPTFVIRPCSTTSRDGVLVGTDCSERSRATLEYAYRQASLRGLPLTVVYSVGALAPDRGAAIIEDDLDGFPDERRELSEAIAGFGEKFPDVPVRLRLARGVADSLLIAESRTMDLVVVGHHAGAERGDLVRLGSFVTPVVESADCPVVVVAFVPGPRTVRP
jgi:nucleotide-binding universal stress UspA family protein